MYYCVNIQTCYSNLIYLHGYCSCVNHYYFFILFSLTVKPSLSLLLLLLHLTPSSLSLSLSLSLFICTADQPSTHHHSTTATHHHPTIANHHHHFKTHKNPTTSSIENQSQNQRKIKPKINKNQWKSNLELMEFQPQHIKRKTQNKPSTENYQPKPKSSHSHVYCR